VFTPVFAKHSKSFSLIDCISVGVDRMQRNIEPMRKQVEAWQRSELTDATAKVVISGPFRLKTARTDPRKREKNNAPLRRHRLHLQQRINALEIIF
jgi:hypothetical protein